MEEHGTSIASGNKEQEILSTEVYEIITNEPHWFVRHSNVIFLVIMALILVTSWFIQYPELVHTSAKLTSVNAPKEVRTRLDGALIKLCWGM